MELGSGCTLACLLPQIWRLLWMQPEPSALALTLKASGFMVPGQRCRPGNLLHTKNSFLFPVFCGPGSMSFFCSNNEAVVAILMTKTLKVPALMHLLCDLLLSAACWGFTFTAAHVPGGENKIADAISCFHSQEFRQLAQRFICPLVRFLSSCWTT